jgi:hypothetical protein
MFDVFYQGPKPNVFAFEQPAESLEDAANKSRTEFFWFIHGLADYTEFDFNWRCVPWEKEHVHVFPSQWQRNGDVYFAHKSHAIKKQWHWRNEQTVKRLADKSIWAIPSNIDDRDFDYSWHPDAAEPPYEYRFPTQWQKQGGPVYPGTAGIKFVTAQKIKANATEIFYMDFLNPGSKDNLQNLKEKWPDVKSTRYVDNHLNVFKRIMNLATTESVWIISSICDYSNFDFTWHPEEWQKEMIHVFPSGNQRRGDTFYINVRSFRDQMYDLELLDWFNVINYCEDQRVQRLPAPYCVYDNDNLINEVKQFNFNFPYAVFTNQPDLQIYHNPCVWTEKDRSVESFTRSNSVAVVPRDVKAHLRTQIYDYPYVKGEEHAIFAEKSLDIIYISNGESNAEEMYEHLVRVAGKEVKRVQNVDGRNNAFKQAAEISSTPWFFKIPAKLRMDEKFDWTWQPDYFQEPKHYIFHARNPLNGLIYGHQAAVVYNKRLVLETDTVELDFTLSKAHEVIPICNAVAEFNADPWMTWRTAFREVVKLKYYSETQPSIETDYRLKVWLTKADGKYAEWCLRGAADAVEYYKSVNGNYDKIMSTYEWAWLKNYFDTKY